METITNIASAASKAVFGEQNTTQGNETAGNEPISGAQGKGTVNEPYDQGNSENPADPSSTTNTTATTASTSNPTSKTETTSAPMNPNNVAAGGEPKPLESTEGTGVTSKQGDPFKGQGSDVIPSESSNNPGAAPSSGAAPSQKQQGADRPQDEPKGDAADAAKESKDDPEFFLKTKDPNDHSGEPMKMHDGPEKKDIPATQEERRESKVGLPGGQEHGKEPKGTGEEWVKTSGLQADGGDFDATKPGAGREADRLMEEKGIKRDAGSGAPAQGTSSTGSGEKEKEKVPLGQKIKDKLHIGHKDK